MRNRNRSADHQRYVECIHELFPGHSAAGALFDVISDAIVAAQDDRTSETHQLFRLLVQRAVFVSLRIQREKSLDAEMAAVQKCAVHLGAITIKLVHRLDPFAILRSCAFVYAVFHCNVPQAGASPESMAMHMKRTERIDSLPASCFMC